LPIFLTMNKIRPRISELEYALVLNSRKAKTERTVLVIGDLHAPFIKEGYLEFCKEMYVKHNCTSVVFTGDILDNHVVSYHESDPDGFGGAEELRLAKIQIKGFYEAFPNSVITMPYLTVKPTLMEFQQVGLKRLMKFWKFLIGALQKNG